MSTIRKDLPNFVYSIPDIFEAKHTFKTITIRWPVGSKIPTVRGKWKRLEDGRIEATYTRDELAKSLEVYEMFAGKKETE